MEKQEVEEVEEGTNPAGHDGQQQNGAVAVQTGLSLLSDGDQPEVSLDPPARSRKLTFAEALVDAGMLPTEDVGKAQTASNREEISLPRILSRDGFIVSRDLAAFMALQLGLTMVDLRSENLDPEVVHLLPQDIALRYTVLALRRDDGAITVAMADPTDLQTLQDLTARTGFRIDPVVAEDQELQEHIAIAYRLERRRPGEEDGVD
jgi:type IV pilus assembly protein PilB